MSRSQCFVPTVHMMDKFLYHPATFCKKLYENALGGQVVVLVVQLPPSTTPLQGDAESNNDKILWEDTLCIHILK